MHVVLFILEICYCFQSQEFLPPIVVSQNMIYSKITSGVQCSSARHVVVDIISEFRHISEYLSYDMTHSGTSSSPFRCSIVNFSTTFSFQDTISNGFMVATTTSTNRCRRHLLLRRIWDQKHTRPATEKWRGTFSGKNVTTQA